MSRAFLNNGAKSEKPSAKPDPAAAPKPRKRDRAAKAKTTDAKVELTKAEAENTTRGAELTKTLSDGQSMIVTLPPELRMSKKLTDAVVTTALVNAKVPMCSVNRHDKKGFWYD